MFDFDLVYGEPYNCRIKMYGDEVGQIMVCDYPVFTPGLEREGQSSAKRLDKAAAAAGDGGEPADTERAARRAKAQVFDYCRSNPDLDCFVTFTLDAEKVDDRYDYQSLQRRLNQWLDNMVRRHGLKYVIVPEQHRDGAWHYHGLVNSTSLKLKDSGHTYKDGRTIYNVENWKFGFTTAMMTVGERERVCRYIAKYITKHLCGEGERRGRFYLSGGALSRPSYRYATVDFGAVEAVRSFTVAGRHFKIL